MSLLDTVEPDCWRKNESVQWDSRIHTTITHKSEFPEKVARLFNSPLYSRETVESLFSQCRKEALLEAADKLEAIRAVHNGMASWELRRMADSVGIQEGFAREGEKE